MQKIINNFKHVMKILENNYKDSTSPSVTLIADRTKNTFNILVSTIISLRTKDEVTTKASKRLFKKAFSFKDIQEMRTQEIENLIYPAGFYKTKAKRLKDMANIIENSLHGNIPDTMEDLLRLPGVGRKTANLVLTLGFNKPGLCVDTHVHRITNRFAWVSTKSPTETEFALKKVLPQKYWRKINDYLVSYGQTICRPISPFCSKCNLNNICPKINVTKKR
ncbi:MAG: endonuclease III [Spirochaetes bacterium]|nr:endonuclease III [Spirochaetota bacterium]